MTSNSKRSWIRSSSQVTGASHEAEKTGCQDFFASTELHTPQGFAVVAISDGAGSALYAREGAEIVVRTWMQHFTRLLENSRPACEETGTAETSGKTSGEPTEDAKDGDESCGEYASEASAKDGPECEPDTRESAVPLRREDALEVLIRIRETVEQRARERNADPADFSATLLGAVLAPGVCFFAQVGDGCWVVEKQGLLGCVTWPTQGEFASQTTFALSASAPEFLQWTAVPGPVAAVAGFTDGVERLGLHLSGRTPAPGFFVPVFGRVRDKGPQAACEITTFLDSDRCRAESDDDKTLLVLISNHAE